MVESTTVSISGRTRRPHRGPTAANGVDNGVEALDIEIGIVESRKRRFGEILGGTRRTYRDESITESRISLRDLRRERRR
ncbi:MAG: hypothetical protein EXR86_00460 [Gammaproteobacteria bacterium]|nr:hypothetical protein [Gammaproteobacteria bacterium]